MTEEQYITALTNNPHGIRNIPNPTEAMQLTCVAQNGMLLQYIKEPTQKVIETALSQAPRAIQFVENPTEELLGALVEKDWAILEYINDPSDSLIRSALAQSGWAIRYIANPSEELQLEAVRANYDALQYIKEPSEAVQLQAVQESYLALRYINEPSVAVLEAAVKQDSQAMRQITKLTKDLALHLFGVSAATLGYIPNNLGVTVDEIKSIIISAISSDTADEDYIRELINNKAIGGRQSKWSIDLLSLIDNYGTQTVKKVAVDEYLKY